jgi:hypothetical protein
VTRNCHLLAQQTRTKSRKHARSELDKAEELFAQQLVQRAKSQLRNKGHMDADWTRRYLIPLESPDYAKWRAKPGAHQGKSVMMKRPTGDEALKPNAGGLKHEQYYPWGTEGWTAAHGLRNGVESVNRNLKRSQFEAIADPDKRAVRGNTFTYLVVALSAVVEDLRQIVSFFKRQLAIVTLTPKNHKLPGTYWHPGQPTPSLLDAAPPPD